MEPWKKMLLVAGGALGAGAVLWYVLKEDKSGKKPAVGSQDDKRRWKVRTAEEVTKEQLHEILKEIIQSQEQMKSYTKVLTQELLSNSLTFDQVYQKVRQVLPKDPLEEHGLSMMDFDKLIGKYAQMDTDVREAITKIMGAPSPGAVASEKVQSISVKKVIDVHHFMLKEMEAVVAELEKSPDIKSYDMKPVTIAAQAIVGSKIEKQFGITSEDVEGAVMMYHANLATDQDFAQVNIRIQHAMGKLMGANFASSS
eukprot:gb/GFBE01063285.1/.p1 GENE.gb/GFBE01063285.1/~~gb/GFBE01063285.1/.p1  ORF type:complete len:255 (+),score=85.66 gb/GFBE01063285.1/:1-765(+)